MRRYLTGMALLFVIVLFTMIIFAGCGAGSDSGSDADGSAKAGKAGPKIVTTIFPEYDWVMNILGDNPAGAEVYLLMDSGVDLHSYQPTTENMKKISECDLLIYNGGISDTWVRDAQAEAVNQDMISLDLMEALGAAVKEEEIKEGMQQDDDDKSDAAKAGANADEHIWLSLRNAASLCGSIEEAMADIDPDHADAYAQNLQQYLDQIKALDQKYGEMTSGAPLHTLLFGDRFPFRYLTDDYDLDYYAAFDGCSAETEASFETIRFLSSKMDELGLPCVMTIDGSDQKIAETIIRSTKEKNQKILTLNSMQSVTADDAKAGASYLGIMEDNFEVLTEALQGGTR